MLTAGLVAGCKKQDPGLGANGSVSDQSASPAAPPSPRALRSMDDATNATVIVDKGDVNATLGQLTQALRDYVVRTRSVPGNFEEFAAKSSVQFPPPPDGKKYAIKGQAVVLVNR